MPRKSLIERDKKRDKLIDKYAEKRELLKAAGDWEGLALLPRNSSPTRRNTRCVVTGRGRGYLRKFGLSRVEFREQASRGNIPGVTKSSW